MKQNWEYKSFGEIISPAKIIKNTLGEDLPILSITMRSGIIRQDCRFSKQIASVDTTTYKVVKNGQLVIAFPIDEGLIYTQDVEERGIMSPAYNIWDVDYSVVNRYFLVKYLHSSSAMNYYKSKLRGTTQRRRSMPKEDLLSMPIPVPSLSTQTVIVSELDALSAIIADHKSLLKKYDELEQSIFYDMFGDPVKNDKGWEVKKLGEVCEVVTKGTTPTTVGFKFEEEGINFIKVECFENGVLNMAKVAHVTEQCHESLKRSQLKENDILICIAGATVGKLAIVTKEILPANTNQACCIIRLSQSYVESRSYIFFILQSDYIKNYIKGLKKGVAQPNLTLDQVRNFLIPNVPLPLQQEFASKIEAIEAMKADTKKSLAKSEELFNARMDYYFNA